MVGRQHFAPRLEPGGFGVVDGGLESFLVVFVGGHAAQVEADGVNLVGFLGRTNEFEQSLTGVQRAVGVVVTEGAVVGPRVADFAEFDGEGFPRFAQVSC